ncbi:N-acetyltransferase family protein [Metabacillus sp. 84]|uniref:GNAT family N-acetyltransferase n=1 Tax=unclassified Metabacillus TaxID=2675274 RepID=UPI003CF2C194
MNMNEAVKEIKAANHLDGLAAMLKLVVNEGSSLGFLPPMSDAAAAEYWLGLTRENLLLLAVQVNGEIAGSVQLHLSPKQNGLHRAEIAKLMTHPAYRKRGIGRLLMEKAEQRAKEEGRSLLVLDAREGAPSNKLYHSLGYTAAGKIPNYAKSADGTLHTTVIFYKEI